jgi:nitronate monooxygenase
VILDQLGAPVVLAPMAGGPSTPELAAAVSEAGGIGFLASGYLTAQDTREQIRAVRLLTARPFGVNVFAEVAGPTDPATYKSYVDRLGEWAEERGVHLGQPRYDNDHFEEKIDLLARDPVAVVSFTFGCPSPAAVERLHSAGSEVWVTVTSPPEAKQAAAAGVDALIVQGGEAGGHRASFDDREDLPVVGLLALLQLVGAQQSVKLVASGGIATGGALAGALAAGASAAQIGSAFMLCPEAGTSPAHREALRSDRETSLTRAFSGRLARGIRNQFMAEHEAEAPIAYPEIHHVTAPFRKAARESGDASLINMWAGETHRLAREAPAADIVQALIDEAKSASAAVSTRLATGER